ncbi:MFS transporter, partial [Streptomyces albiflaviniger]|nr:MFS transporter [Streptomyces albiflaviniger]
MGSIADLTSLTISFCLVTTLALGLVAGAGVLRTPAGTGATGSAPHPDPSTSRATLS